MTNKSNEESRFAPVADKDVQNETTPATATTTPDPFDPERWRRRAVGNGPKVKRLLTTVPVRMKPADDKFARVHPHPAYRFEASIVAIKDEGDYLILPAIENSIPTPKLLLPVTLFTAITYAGDPFIWVAKYPATSKSAFARWAESMREIIELAMTTWLRVESNTGIGAYVPVVAEGKNLAEPTWPDMPFGKLLEIAFSGRRVDRPDHPLINRLRGDSVTAAPAPAPEVASSSASNPANNLPAGLFAAGFREVVVCDFEYNGWNRHDLGSEVPSPDGNPPLPVCMVARELVSGREHRLWYADGWASEPPFPIGPDTLFVAFNNAAEMGCFLALGWPIPARQLDLYVEFKMLLNETRPEGAKSPPAGLLDAMEFFGLDAVGAGTKHDMRMLALRGGPYSAAERDALLDYCAGDVDAVARLFCAML